jgi:NitT/TauT family transport system substrate-binding protein
LKSLTQAENYLYRNPEAAKAIIQKRVNYDDVLIKTFWSENQFTISLDQSLIVAMEDEARWMISNNLTTGKAGPQFPGLHL